MTRAAIIGWALACTCACRDAEPISQTIVWLEAEPAAEATLTRVKVQAIGPAENREPAVEIEDFDWPIKLVFAPKYADASRRFTLQIDARDDRGVRLASLQLRTGFVEKQTRHVTLRIQDECAVQPTADCGEERACNDWNGELEADELGLSAMKSRKMNARCQVAADEGMPEAGAPAAGGGAPRAGTGGTQAGSGAGPTAGAAGTAPTRPIEGPTGACGVGFEQVGDDCIDRNECATANPCGEHGACQNREGDYTCECEAGYAMQAGSCDDVNECQTDNGGCESACINTIGSAACGCEPPETWLRVDRKTCGSFGEAKRVALIASTQPAQPRFAFDAEGNGLAVWIHSDAMSTNLWARRYRAVEGWATLPVRIATTAGASLSVPRVALDASGRGVVLWTETVEMRTDLWAARYTGQSFSPAEKIESNDAGNAYDPWVVLADGGDGYAVWTQSDGTLSRIWANRFSVADGWATAEPVHDATENAFGARIALDWNGAPSVVWTQLVASQMEGTRVTPWATQYDPVLSRWRTPELIDDRTTAGVPDIARFDAGALTVWTRADAGSVTVWARGASDAVDITAQESSLVAVIPRVALSRAGRGGAVWAQGAIDAVQVWGNRYDGASDSWARAKQLSAADSTAAPSPQIAVDPTGDGFAVWSEIAGTARVIRAQRLQADGFAEGLALATDVTAATPQNSPPQIAVDPQGRALAIWDVHESGQYVVWARVFE